ncbi:hypothetical protein DIPPA_19784 [Diplonema papillatum]|nr:hypothetical protein DIPPA_19784 [Diplonema papillatum]
MAGSDAPVVERKRSMSSGTGRKNLTINTAFTVLSNRRTKRLVLGPGQSSPGGDNVHLVPDMADAADPKHFLHPPKGKKITMRNANRESTKVKKEKTLVHRKPQKQTHEILLHVNAECGYEDNRTAVLDHRTVQRERQERLDTERPAFLMRNGAEPIGLTIDENLMVTNIVPNTPAAKAGLTPGVRLSSVNGAYVYSQGDAIDALRNCGEEVAVGLMSDTTAASLAHDKVVAGKRTALAAADVRGRRVVGSNPEYQRVGPPFGTSTPGPDGETPRRGLPHLGPPGLGPQTVDWGGYGPREDGTIGGCPSPIVTTDDPFKPNLYIPRPRGSVARSMSTPVVSRRCGGQGNKTSYQLAVDKGETDTDGHWDTRNAMAKTGKVHMSVSRTVIENQNGDIIANADAIATTPRRAGKDRAASPTPRRRPALGAPGVHEWEGEKRSASTGRRFFPKSEGVSLLLEGHLPEDASNARLHDQMRGLRSYTPGRYRFTPGGAGDIIGHTHGAEPVPSPRGLRKQPAIEDPPKAVQKLFVPTPRRQVPTPTQTDIFNRSGYRGDCKDQNDIIRSQNHRNIVGVSPRHHSSVEIAHQPNVCSLCCYVLFARPGCYQDLI